MKRVLHILGILSMAFFLGACGKKENIVTETPTISVVHSSYAIDVDSYAALAGSADYVIIGNVIEEQNVEYKHKVEIETENGGSKTVGSPYTNYLIEVEENLKGELNQDTPIVIQKEGGVAEDGKSYIMRDGDILPVEGGRYVFYIYAQENGQNLVSGKNSTIPLNDASTNGISTMAASEKSDEEILMEIRNGVENPVPRDRDRSISSDDVSVK